MDYAVERAVYAGLTEVLRKHKLELSSDLRWEIITTITRRVNEVGDSTHRTLLWKVKHLGKELGKASQKIYDLRCQLAEARDLIAVDRTGYRSLLDQARGLRQRVADLQSEIRQLQLKLKVVEECADPEAARALELERESAEVRSSWVKNAEVRSSDVLLSSRGLR